MKKKEKKKAAHTHTQPLTHTQPHTLTQRRKPTTEAVLLTNTCPLQ